MLIDTSLKRIEKSNKYQTIVKDHIVQILLRYDISTVQEIRESSGTSFPKLVADMNAIAGDIYDFHVGARQEMFQKINF